MRENGHVVIRGYLTSLAYHEQALEQRLASLEDERMPIESVAYSVIQHESRVGIATWKVDRSSSNTKRRTEDVRRQRGGSNCLKQEPFT